MNPDKRSNPEVLSAPRIQGVLPLMSAAAPARLIHWERGAVTGVVVERACDACTAMVSHCDTPERLRSLLRAPDWAAAIVALDSPQDVASVDAIAILRHAGLQVVAHDRGTDGWAVSARCRILLAGAWRLLDSAQLGFEETLRATLAELLADLATRRDEESRLRALAHEHGIVGESVAVMDAFRKVVRFSPLSDLPVLITGESGTGKELFACALHALDPKRRARPLVAVNCAAITAGIAESELFGHVRGAFTGADREHAGLFHEAQGGVLFLDEVAELDPPVQAKILRVLQERRMIRVGAGRDAAVDIRIIAATNKDLGSMASEGTFRVDLFHRLNTLAIHIPPLRERRADIAPLVAHFMSVHATWREPEGVADDLLEALSGLALEGNVRELRNLIAAAQAAKADRFPLGLRDLPPQVWRELSPAPSSHAAAADSPQPRQLAASVAERHGWNLAKCLGACEREIMAAAMQRTRNNQSKAARLLGVTPRSVYNKLRRHGLPLKSAG